MLPYSKEPETSGLFFARRFFGKALFWEGAGCYESGSIQNPLIDRTSWSFDVVTVVELPCGRPCQWDLYCDLLGAASVT